MFARHLFPGGIHPQEGKNGKRVNGGNAIAELPAPPRVIIPLSQHIGAPAKAVVQKGDHVRIGQVIGEAGGFVSAPVHASVSGTVVSVEDCILANGGQFPAVVIANDYQEEWVELHPAEHPERLTAQELQTIVRNAGIVGMGGATFPTAVKFTPGQGKTIQTLIVNGAECEPYLTADHRLMLERGSDLIDGIRLIMLALNIREAVIGIEENKPDAIQMLTKAAQATDGIRVQSLPVRYPQGGEKQLVYAITRKVVPAGGLPLDVGVVVSNVGTVVAVDDAIRKGMPLISRVTTVGGLVNNPGNWRVRIGTTVDHLIEASGGMQSGVRQFIYGGPMMGQAIARGDIPVTKGCSGIVCLREEAKESLESPCIRCGRCAQHCPMRLQPLMIDAYVRVDNYEGAERAGVMNCIECGICTFVCPAKRCITQACRTAKSVINTRRRQEQARQAAEAAKAAAAEGGNN